MALGWDCGVKIKSHEAIKSWTTNQAGSTVTERYEEYHAHLIRPADFTRLEFAPFALGFIGIVAAGVVTLITVATVTLLSSFH